MNSVHELGSGTMSKNRLKNNTESKRIENRPSAPRVQPAASPRAKAECPAARLPRPYSASACRALHACLRVRSRLLACRPPATRPSACAPLPPARPSTRLRLLRAWPCRNAQRRVAAPSCARPAPAHVISRPRPSTSSQYSLYCDTNLLPTKLYCNTVSSAARLPLLQYT